MVPPEQSINSALLWYSLWSLLNGLVSDLEILAYYIKLLIN